MITHFKCKCGRAHTVGDNAKHVVCLCGQFIDVAEQAVWLDESGPISPDLFKGPAPRHAEKRMDFGQQDSFVPDNVTVLTRPGEHPCGATTHPDGTVMCQQCGLSWDKDDTPPTCPNA